MNTHYDRCYGALLGLAYGDAIGFPSLFHRFHDRRIPRRRHDYLWRTNRELDEQRILRLTLPFTHRTAAEILGIETPFADGRVLWELFTDPADVPVSTSPDRLLRATSPACDGTDVRLAESIDIAPTSRWQ